VKFRRNFGQLCDLLGCLKGHSVYVKCLKTQYPKWLFISVLIMDMDRMLVVACRPGTYSVGGLTPCKQCPLGTYQSDYGRTLCLPCGAGIMTSNVGATGFQDCIVSG